MRRPTRSKIHATGIVELELRNARPEDLIAASELCFRSKAHWGYDAAFMEAYRRELTLTHRDLRDDHVILSEDESRLTGVAQVSFDHHGCCLERLFVDPRDMGKGIGRKLFERSVFIARGLGAKEMLLDADPQAAPFYLRMGCRLIGTVMSESIPGRSLPRLAIDLAHQRL